MTAEIIGLVHYNASTPLDPRPQTEFDVGAIIASAKAQEAAGYDRVLIANTALMPDCHTIGAHVAANTTRLGLMLAHRPGFIAPTMAARLLATVDQLSGGRAGVHIIAGPSDKELEADGDFLTKDERYHRALEYVGIMRRLWESEVPVDHEGRYYRFNQAFVPVKPVQKPAIPVFWGGTSDISVESCAQCADIFALSGDSLKNTREMVEKARDAAAKYGRTLHYMMTLIIILGETEQEAWDKADAALDAFLELQQKRNPDAAAKGPTNFDVKSDNRSRQLRTAEEGERQDRCLWMGMTKAAGGKSGNQTTLVGTPAQVTDALMDYYAMGVTKFLLRGYRPLEDIPEFGRTLIPMFRGQAAAFDAQSR
jgi:alkanesulfonate monooxygenase